MYTVQLVFNLQRPDAEDQPVRDYLNEHQLEPRYQSQGEHEGEQYETLQFGGCYLGRHLNEVGQIQLQVVREEVLTEAIEAHLALLPQSATWTPTERQATLDTLVQRFNEESVFQTNEQGDLVAVLDGAAVRETAQGVRAQA